MNMEDTSMFKNKSYFSTFKKVCLLNSLILIFLVTRNSGEYWLAKYGINRLLTVFKESDVILMKSW